jgi:hypothetical protein
MHRVASLAPVARDDASSSSITADAGVFKTNTHESAMDAAHLPSDQNAIISYTPTALIDSAVSHSNMPTRKLPFELISAWLIAYAASSS